MPRDGSGVYSPPAGSTAVPNTTIESAKYNALVADLVQDANTARPVVAGGTGAVTADAARTELGAAGLTDENVFTKSQTWAEGAAIASAATLTLGTDGNFFHVTGTTTITAISGNASPVTLVFDGALTFTHNGTSLILPGAANITTAAGDTAIMVSEGSGNWRCVNYQRQAVEPAQGGGWITLTTITASNQAAIDIDNIPSGAKIVEIYIDDLQPVDNGQNLRLRVRRTGEASFDNGSTDYNFNQLRSTVGGSVVEAGSATASSAIITSGIGNAVSRVATGTITIHEPGAARRTAFTYQSYGIDSAGNQFSTTGGGRRNAAAAVDAIRLDFGSGNVNTATVRVRYFL